MTERDLHPRKYHVGLQSRRAVPASGTTTLVWTPMVIARPLQLTIRRSWQIRRVRLRPRPGGGPPRPWPLYEGLYGLFNCEYESLRPGDRFEITVKNRWRRSHYARAALVVLLATDPETP
jgi:hypothetical protein